MSELYLPLLKKVDDENFKDFKLNFKVNLDSCPHWLISGVTGSGKTFYSVLMLGALLCQYRDFNTPITLYIADFKGDESFSFLEDYSHYYKFDKARKAIDEVYDILLARQSGDQDRSKIILFFDEYAAFIGFLPKKEAEDYKNKIKNILMLGRSLSIHLIISVQRASAELFSQARDQFSVNLILGALSKEVKNMFFSDYLELIDEQMGRGEGYILIDGQGFFKCKVEKIGELEELQPGIRKMLDLKN